MIDFKPKPPGDYDVDLKVEYCGVCGSDVSDSVQLFDSIYSPEMPQIHTITGGWGEVMLVCAFFDVPVNFSIDMMSLSQ